MSRNEKRCAAKTCTGAPVFTRKKPHVVEAPSAGAQARAEVSRNNAGAQKKTAPFAAALLAAWFASASARPPRTPPPQPQVANPRGFSLCVFLLLCRSRSRSLALSLALCLCDGSASGRGGAARRHCFAQVLHSPVFVCCPFFGDGAARGRLLACCESQALPPLPWGG